MIYLLYVLFVYFSTRGILIHFHLLNEGIDSVIGVSLKLIFIAWLLQFIVKTKREVIGRKYVFFLLLIILVSSLANLCSVEKVFRFTINTIYPLSIFYYLVYTVSGDRIKKLFRFIVIYLLLQIGFSFVFNLPIFIKGTIIIDDTFFGFFGVPRAYQFSFLCSLISFFYLNKFYTYRKSHHLVLFLIFASVQFFAGAGRILIMYILALLFLSFRYIKINLKTMLIFVVFLFVFVPTVSYYNSKNVNFSESITLLKEESLMKNPKIFYFMMSLEPITKDAKNFFIGKGPGNYMSWTGMNFNPKLVKKYNDDLHGQFSTDAYQAFNNIIGFLGEIGLLGFLIYYSLVFKILFVGGKTITNNQKNSKTALFQVVVFSLLLSTMVHIFDDAYYSLSFWLLSGILYRKIKDENINCNALIQSRAVHRGNDKVSAI